MLLPTDLPRCVLRPWRQGDQPALLRHADNRKVWRNLTELFPHPYTPADAEAWLALAAEAAAPSIHCAIEVDGEAVGGVGVIADDGIHRMTGRFGYWLGESWWGRGIATVAARTLVAHVFAATGIERLEASVFEWNPASMRVLEKVGFTREGVLRRSVWKDGALIDSVLYARLRGG